MKTFTAYIERDLETGVYIGSVPSITGAHTQGDTLEELRKNLKEVIELCLEELDEPLENLAEFVGIEEISVDVV